MIKHIRAPKRKHCHNMHERQVMYHKNIKYIHIYERHKLIKLFQESIIKNASKM